MPQVIPLAVTLAVPSSNALPSMILPGNLSVIPSYFSSVLGSSLLVPFLPDSVPVSMSRPRPSVILLIFVFISLTQEQIRKRCWFVFLSSSSMATFVSSFSLQPLLFYCLYVHSHCCCCCLRHCYCFYYPFFASKPSAHLSQVLFSL